MSETLVLNDLTACGLRRMHIVRMGAPVQLDNWIDQVPGEAINLLKVACTHEQDLDVHHLWMVWNAREMVNFILPDRQQVLGTLWWIEKGESVRWSTDLAANLYVLKTGRMPDQVWIRERPKAATDEIEVDITRQGVITLRLDTKLWIPTRFVIVVNGGLRHGETEAVEMPERARDGAGDPQRVGGPAVAAVPAGG